MTAAIAFLALARLSATEPDLFKVPARPAPSVVLATVDGVPVKASEVEALLWDWRASEVVQDLVGYRLVAAEAARKKILLDPKRLEEEVAKQVATLQQQAPSGGDPEAALRERGFPPSRLRLRIATDLLLDSLARAEFDPSAWVKVSTLGFPVKSPSSEDLKAALDAAQKAYDRLKKGEAWGTVLRDATQDPAFLQNEGALDWNPVSAFPEPTQKELAQLKAGEVTRPVQTNSGIQLFRIDLKAAEAKAGDRETLFERVLPTLKEQIFTRLRTSAKIERPGSRPAGG